MPSYTRHFCRVDSKLLKVDDSGNVVNSLTPELLPGDVICHVDDVEYEGGCLNDSAVHNIAVIRLARHIRVLTRVRMIATSIARRGYVPYDRL